MTRVAAFVLVLAVVFAGAYGVGALLDLEPKRAAAQEEPHGGEPMAGPATAEAEAAGLAVASGGLRLVAETTSFTPGRAAPFAFRILRAGNEPVTRYEVEHERPMHLIVVRRDLAAFQHLHPTMGADGTWTAQLRLPAGGTYRAFADFVAGGEQRTLGIDLFAAGEQRPIAPPRSGVRMEEHELRTGSPQMLRFDAGGPVEHYLGAAGHLVILREGDLAYLHNHADEEALEFETTFPSPGRYRAFLQVKRGGSVETATFELGVR